MFARGMLKYWVLRVLSERERSGYEVMKAVEERIGWRPSPGSIYPLLQLLSDQGLIQGRDEDHKTVWSLTEAGQAALSRISERKEEWLRALGTTEKAVLEAFGDRAHPIRIVPRLAALLHEAIAAGKGREAAGILEEAGQRLSALVEE